MDPAATSPTLWIVGAVVAVLLMMIPGICSLIAAGYWAGSRHVSGETNKIEIDAIKKGLDSIERTLTENLRLLRDDQSKLWHVISRQGERISALEACSEPESALPPRRPN